MRLIVIAKSPVPGRSKTRLCPPCSPQDAARVAEAALRDTLEACLEASVEDRVLALDGAPGDWAAGFRVIEQRGVGLDQRIWHAFEDAGTDPSILIGMDTPQVSPELLDGAGRALLAPGIDGVLGAAADGGWWAMGLRRPRAAHILGVPMSSAHTLDRQRARWNTIGMRYTELTELTDIDTFGDARAVASTIPGSRTAAVVRSLDTRLSVSAW